MEGGGGGAAAEEAPRCAVCLCDVDEPAVLDSCAHTFCGDCILAWSLRESRCPLCKRRFTRVLHAGKSVFVAQVDQRYEYDWTAEDEEGVGDIVCAICTEGALSRCRRCCCSSMQP